jgi:hypothetical protein
MAGLTVIKKGDQEPILTDSTSAQIKRNKELVAVPVDSINEAFARGYITAGQRNGIMREKAHAVVNEMIQEKGFFGAVLAKSLKHIQDGFDNIKDAVVREVPADKMEAFKADMMASGQAIWGQVQVLTGVFSAIGEVTGAQVERWALNAGASPGLARLINISTDVGSGFIPVGKATQSAVKGIQRAQKLGAKSVTNQAGRLGKGGEDVTRMTFTSEAPELGPLKDASGSLKAALADGRIKRAPENHYELTDEGIRFLEANAPEFADQISRIQGVGKAVKEQVGGKSAEEAKKAAEAAEKAMTEMEGTNKLAIEAIGEGLKAEGVSRRGFLQFLATVPTAAKAAKDMLKGSAKSAAPAAAKSAEVAPAAAVQPIQASTMYKSIDESNMLIRMKDGAMIHADMDSTGGRVLSKEGRELTSIDYGAYDTEFRHLVADDPKFAGYARTVQAIEEGEAIPGAEALKILPMDWEQEMFVRTKLFGETPREAASEIIQLRRNLRATLKDIHPDDIEKNQFLKERQSHVDASKPPKRVKGEKRPEPKSFDDTFKEEGIPPNPHADVVPEGIEEPGQLVMVNGRWHVRGPGPDDLTPAIYGEGTAQEKFLADLAKFRREMGSLTETQTHAMTKEMSDRLNLGLDDLRNVVPGQALDEKQMLAYLKALEPQVEELIRLAKAVPTGGEAEFNAFASHMSEFFTFAPKFRGAEVTAGRSVEILKETPPMKSITEMLMGWDPESVAKGDFNGAIRTMAEDFLAVADKPDHIAATAVLGNTLWGQFKKDMWPMMREAYINLMLARPVTHVRNIAGNTYSAGNAAMERMAGGMFSIDKEKGLVGQEGWYLLKGMGAGITDGLAEFGKAYRGKGDLITLEGKPSKLDYVPHKIPGIVGRIINTPGDTLRGTDNFYRTILKRGSYYSEAYRDAVHSGMSNSPKVIASEAYRDKFGNESLSEFVQRRVNFPTRSMVANAEEFATHNTFQDELGALASKIRAVGQVGPLVLWFPFMKTPINMAKYAWDRTPGLQLISSQLYADIAAGGVKADMAIGRLTMSNLQAMFIYNLAQEGYITGSGPVDPGLRRAWMASNQPYSVKTKDGWMPITNFEPGTTPIGLVADFAQIHNQLDAPGAEQAAMAATFAIMKGMADKTYWRTLSDLVDAAGSVKEGSSPKSQLRDVVLQPFMSAATGGPLGGSFTRAIDPIQRETREFMDSVMSRVPAYSKDVPPVRDYLGEPVLPPQAVGGPWLNLVQPQNEEDIPDERVRNEGKRLQIKAPVFPSSLGGSTRDDFDIRAPFPEEGAGVELTSKERDEWQQRYRDNLRHPEFGIEKLWLDTPTYKEATRAGQREMFMDALALYRSKARDELLTSNPKLGARLLESQAKKLLPMLGPKDQDAAMKEAQEGMTLFYRMAPQMQENLMRWGQPPGED